MKFPGTVFGTLALLWGFGQAPFAHIHPGDDDHPSTSSLVHWHLAAEPLDGASACFTAQTADDDAIDVAWNVVRTSIVHIACDFSFAGRVSEPPVAMAAAPIPMPRRTGHDPPELAPASPRAPPL